MFFTVDKGILRKASAFDELRVMNRPLSVRLSGIISAPIDESVAKNTDGTFIPAGLRSVNAIFYVQNRQK